MRFVVYSYLHRIHLFKKKVNKVNNLLFSVVKLKPFQRPISLIELSNDTVFNN